MPYTVKVPPITSRQQGFDDVVGSLPPLLVKPVTAITGEFPPGRGVPSSLAPALPQVIHTNRNGRGSDLVAVGRLLTMPLDIFAREDQLLEVGVPWLPVTLWFVPSEADGERLVRQGIGRGRIWTARELDDLVSCAGLGPDQVKVVALAKIEFDGTVVDVLRSE